LLMHRLRSLMRPAYSALAWFVENAATHVHLCTLGGPVAHAPSSVSDASCLLCAGVARRECRYSCPSLYTRRTCCSCTVSGLYAFCLLCAGVARRECRFIGTTTEYLSSSSNTYALARYAFRSKVGSRARSSMPFLIASCMNEIVRHQSIYLQRVPHKSRLVAVLAVVLVKLEGQHWKNKQRWCRLLKIFCTQQSKENQL
jgi:hypothetical protein